MKSCVMEVSLDERCIEFDAGQARQFLLDECFPVFYEALADVKAKAGQIDAVLTEDMRGGEAGVSCSGDSHGNVSCEGHITIRW